MDTSPAGHGDSQYTEIVHHSRCEARVSGQPPTLHISVHPSPGGGTVLLRAVELCPTCPGFALYFRERVPARKWHRDARKRFWLAVMTWEHRHEIWRQGSPSP